MKNTSKYIITSQVKTSLCTAVTKGNININDKKIFFFFPLWFMYFSGSRNLQRHIDFPPVWCSPQEQRDRTKPFSNRKRKKIQQTTSIHFAKALCVPAI